SGAGAAVPRLQHRARRPGRAGRAHLAGRRGRPGPGRDRGDVAHRRARRRRAAGPRTGRRGGGDRGAVLPGERPERGLRCARPRRAAVPAPRSGSRVSAVPVPAPAPRTVAAVSAGLLLGVLLSALDQMIVAAALRTIAGRMGGAEVQAWAMSAYLVASVVS